VEKWSCCWHLVRRNVRNPLVALLHFFVYAGFIIINLEVLEIILDGILGTHRLFAPILGGFLQFLINAFEVFGRAGDCCLRDISYSKKMSSG
jgi:hypothetical protein